MINRRKFVQSGLLAGAAGVLPLQGLAGIALPDRPVLQQIVDDFRYPQTRALAQGMLAAWPGPGPDRRLRSVDGNITRFWLDELRPQWLANPVYLAGATGKDVLFCFEHLAASHGMRVLWRQEQGRGGDATAGGQPLLSWLIGPRSRSLALTVAGNGPLNNQHQDNWSL